MGDPGISASELDMIAPNARAPRTFNFVIVDLTFAGISDFGYNLRHRRHHSGFQHLGTHSLPQMIPTHNRFAIIDRIA